MTRRGARGRGPPRCCSWPTRRSLSKGVTSFQDAGSSFETIDVMKKVAAEGKLGRAPLGDGPRHQRAHGAEARRPTAWSTATTSTSPSAPSSTRSTAPWARAGPGCSSPTRTCPRARGLNTTPAGRRSRRRPGWPWSNGYQLCVHAIGDRANRETLDLFEAALQGRPRQEGPALAHRARPAPRTPPTSRASASSASSPPCRASTAPPTRSSCPRGWATSAPPRAPTSGRSS